VRLEPAGEGSLDTYVIGYNLPGARPAGTYDPAQVAGLPCNPAPSALATDAVCGDRGPDDVCFAPGRSLYRPLFGLGWPVRVDVLSRWQVNTQPATRSSGVRVVVTKRDVTSWRPLRG
jgi:hypothetical protein